MHKTFTGNRQLWKKNGIEIKHLLTATHGNYTISCYVQKEFSLSSMIRLFYRHDGNTNTTSIHTSFITPHGQQIQKYM